MSNEPEILRLHFEQFEYDELLEVLMDKESISIRQSTLPDDWYVRIEQAVFEKLKLSLLISNCIVKQEEDSINVNITR